MFLHRKELIQPVNVGTPDARFGTYLLEQFANAMNELTAANFSIGYSRFTSRMPGSGTCFRTSRSRNSAISKWLAS